MLLPDSTRPANRELYLIAEGESKADILTFWLYIDGKIIPIAYDNDSVEAVSTYFKSFYVFDISYPKGLENFLTFIQTTFFNIEGEKVPTIVREVRSLILS